VNWELRLQRWVLIQLCQQIFPKGVMIDFEHEKRGRIVWRQENKRNRSLPKNHGR
jgi:hypothetical protein